MSVWQKFLTALIWAITSVRAAFGIIVQAPATKTPALIGETTGGGTLNGPPVDGSSGVDVEGWATLIFFFEMGDPTATGTVLFWVWDGAKWYETESVTVDAATDGENFTAPPWFSEGSGRVYGEWTASSAHDSQVSVFPNNA